LINIWKEFMKKKIRITLKILLTFVIVIFITVTVLNIYICSSVKDRIYTADALRLEEADCILVLGAGVRDDGSPSHMLEDRLIVGKQLYDHGVSEYLLLSGDHGREDYDEVNAMLEYMLDKGVPRDPIFLDHAGFSTYESLYRAKEIFGAEKIIIVTHKYHLYRALYLADALGLDAVGASADLRTYVGQSMRETREIAARVKDFFYALIQPAPACLGEKIPLAGSGEVTNG